ncbi:hypothetical protein L1887_02830 [Cichorium endivia]|nr:hypothetical protein L1887_02830 [Cichorium endivia]
MFSSGGRRRLSQTAVERDGYRYTVEEHLSPGSVFLWFVVFIVVIPDEKARLLKVYEAQCHLSAKAAG